MKNQYIARGVRSHQTNDRADVVVVGAGFAGAATAMLLAASGHDVLVVDRSVSPGDSPATHGISRDGVVQLHRWGLVDRVLDSGAPAVREVVVHADGTSVSRTIEDRAGVDFLVAPRRQILDSILLDAARAAGARIRTGVTIDGVHRADDGRVTGLFGRIDSRPVDIASRFVVGADGLQSRVARSVGAPFIDVRPSSGALHYGYFRGDWSAIEYIPGDHVLGGIFPTHEDEAWVWVSMPTGDAERIRRRSSSPRHALAAMIATAPVALTERLAHAEFTGSARGMLHLPNHVRQAVGDGWALVGDAGYHGDPVSGHGVSDAFRDAELLADALDDVLRGDLDESIALPGYQTRRDEMLREIFEITCELAQFPRAHRFTELLERLGRAIDHEADRLAATPTRAAALAVV